MKILAVPLVVAAVLTLFAWPAARMEPRDLPIGVAGSPPATKAIDAHAFDVHRYADENAAREAIEEREVYGAFVSTPVAPGAASSASSPAVAQLLTHAAAEAHASSEDVVSAKRGGALASSVLPLVLAGIVTGILATSLLTLVGGSILAGLAATAIVDGWLDVLGGALARQRRGVQLRRPGDRGHDRRAARMAGGEGDRPRRAAHGARRQPVLRRRRRARTAAPPVGDLGQLLPPGAGGNLLRSTGFFDGAAAGRHVAVLAVWAVAGMVLLLAHRAARSTTRLA